MLHLICGDIGTGKTTHILSEIYKHVAQRKKVFLIVPEQETVSYEHLLSERMPNDAPFYLEVTNFSRLSDIIFRVYGGLTFRHIGKSERSLIMWRTLGEIAPLLRTMPQEIDTAKVQAALSATMELQMQSLSPALLLQMADQTEEHAFRDKLSDLALLSTTFHTVLNRDYSDRESEVERLCEILSKEPFFADIEVYLDSFTSFTAEEYKIIEQILRQTDLTVTLPLPESVSGSMVHEEVRATKRKLLTLAARRNTAHQITFLSEQYRTQDPLLRYIGAHMGSASPRSVPPFQGTETHASVQVAEGKNIFDTVEFLAADIAKEIYGGKKYRDLAIIVGDTAPYEGLLEIALQKYKIPYFLSKQTDISSFSAIQLLYAAYATAMRFQRKDLITYMKCGFSGIAEEDLDLFELYTEQWNIQGKRFYDALPWNMNPYGITDRHDAHGDEILRRVNTVREALIAPLLPLQEFCREKHTVREHATVLYEFLESISLQKSLHTMAEEAHRIGEDQEADLLCRLGETIVASLDRLVSVLADTVVSAEGFVELLQIVFSDIPMGQIPITRDEVLIGTADRIRTEAKHVYLLGVHDGEFPRPIHDQSIFSPKEKQQMEAWGYGAEETPAETASKEQFYFYRAFRAATERVTLLYALSDASFAPLTPAKNIFDILHLGGSAISFFRISELAPEETVFQEAAAFENLGALPQGATKDFLKEHFSAHPAYADRMHRYTATLSANKEHISAEMMRQLYPNIISTTQSRIEAYAKCPFSYFCNYFLQPQEHAEAKPESTTIGTYMHLILERFFAQLQENEQSIRDMDDEAIRAMIRDISRTYIRLLCGAEQVLSGRIRVLFSRLERASFRIIKNLQEEFSQSKFVPRFFEFSIGEKEYNAGDALEFSTDQGTKIRIYGKIDRVDTYQKGDDVYIRVVDYKTGRKEFALSDLKHGVNLQMMIYLFLLWRSEDPQWKVTLGCKNGGAIFPAGVLYMPASSEAPVAEAPSSDKADALLRKNFQRNGLFLEDEEILRAMDQSLQMEFIPIKRNKNGTLAPKRSLATLADMGVHMETVKTTICELMSEMEKGNATLLPQDTPDAITRCDHCSFRPICRKA